MQYKCSCGDQICACERTVQEAARLAEQNRAEQSGADSNVTQKHKARPNGGDAASCNRREGKGKGKGTEKGTSDTDVDALSIEVEMQKTEGQQARGRGQPQL